MVAAIVPAARHLRRGIEQVCEAGAAMLNRHWALFLAAYTVVYFGATALLAATRLFWHDEISTVLFSGLRGDDLYAGLMRGADSHPPLFFALTRWSRTLLGATELGTRLPAIAGFWLMTVAVFVYVRKRADAVYAAAAICLLLVTSTYSYAYEARPYALLMGFAALALVSWQHAGEQGRGRIVGLIALAASLALAISSHYFAVLLWIPLALGEMIRSWPRRRIDFAVWAALLAGLAPLPFYMPLLRGLRAAVGTNFWSRPSPVLIEDTYRDFMGLALPPLVAAIVLWASFVVNGRPAAERRRIPPHEFAAAFFLAALPVFALLLAYVSGGYTHRYAIACVAGIAITLTFIAYRASRGHAALGLVLVAVLGGWYVLKVPAVYRRLAAERGAAAGAPARPFDRSGWLAYAAASNLPVAAANSVFYMQLQHYAPAAIEQRVHYMADKDIALRYVGQSTGDILMTTDAELFGLRVSGYREFIAEHPRFLLLVNLQQPNWQLPKMLDDGAGLVLKGRSDTELLYEVTVRP